MIPTFFPRHTIRPPVSIWTLISFESFPTGTSWKSVQPDYTLFSRWSINTRKSFWSRESWEKKNNLQQPSISLLVQCISVNCPDWSEQILNRPIVHQMCPLTWNSWLCVDFHHSTVVTCVTRILFFFLPCNPLGPVKPGSPLDPSLYGLPSGPTEPRIPGSPGWPWSPKCNTIFVRQSSECVSVFYYMLWSEEVF